MIEKCETNILFTKNIKYREINFKNNFQYKII